MPYVIRKIRNKSCYYVMNRKTRRKFSECSSLENAKKQLHSLKSKMPYVIHKTRNKNCYSVMNRRTRRKFSKCSSLENANKQLRLLRALQFNKDFVMRPTQITKKANSNN